MDKRKIKNAMALIGLMGILLYGACGSEKKEIPKQIYIGVACYDQRDTFLGELLEDFKRECRTLEKRGYDISPVSYTHLDVYKRQLRTCLTALFR